MEGLRIRIPQIFHCFVDDCIEYTRSTTYICRKCRTKMLLARMREEVTPATFARETKTIHSPPLRRYLSG
jgi:hypothetical protein